MKRTVEKLMDEVLENLQKIEDFNDWYEAEPYLDAAQEAINQAYNILEKHPKLNTSMIDVWQDKVNLFTQWYM